MSDHGLENQPNQFLVTKVKQLEGDIKELRTIQVQGNNALNLGTSIWSNAPISCPPGLNWVYAKYYNSQGNPVFGNLEFTFYEGSVSPANIVDPFYPTTWGHWDIRWWCDYADSYTSGDQNYGPMTALVYHFAINNLTAGTLTIVFTGRMRVIASSGTNA